jgi:hypothetical protein
MPMIAAGTTLALLNLALKAAQGSEPFTSLLLQAEAELRRTQRLIAVWSRYQYRREK